MTERHFSTEGGGTPTEPGRFVDVEAIEALRLVPGLDFRPVLGTGVLLNFASHEPHSEAPMHSHAEEQIVIVTEGEFEFTIDGVTRTILGSDRALHGARGLSVAEGLEQLGQLP